MPDAGAVFITHWHAPGSDNGTLEGHAKQRPWLIDGVLDVSVSTFGRHVAASDAAIAIAPNGVLTELKRKFCNAIDSHLAIRQRLLIHHQRDARIAA